MSPERKENIGPHKVEEFYWAGRMIVYVDDKLTSETFDDAVSGIKGALDHQSEQHALGYSND